MSDILDQTAPISTPNPTPSSNRIVQLDIFRGFAILGIFMVNILVMNVSFTFRNDWLMENTDAFNSTGKLNEITYWCLEMFFFNTVLSNGYGAVCLIGRCFPSKNDRIFHPSSIVNT